MTIAAIAISILALLFAVASFWWLNARRGSLTAVVPRTYAFVEGFRLRLPLALVNSGAIPLLVTDLRIDISDAGRFPWQTTRSKLRPDPDDAPAFATPFAVNGRDTKALIAEFGDNDSWIPKPGAKHTIQLEARVHPHETWIELATFTWWAPPTDSLMNRYITHRNEPRNIEAPPGEA
jgi:hypothetical protein